MLKFFSILWSSSIVIGLATGIYCSLIVVGIITFVLTICKVFRLISKTNFILITLSIWSGYYLYHRQLTKHNLFLATTQNQTATITGLVTEYHKINNARLKHRLTIQIQSIQPAALSSCVNQSIYIYTQSSPKVLIGQTVQVSDLKFKNSPDDKFKEFLLRDKVSASTFAPDLKLAIVSFDQSYQAKIKQLKQDISKRLTKKMTPQTAAAFNSIFLGHKHIHPYEQAQIKNNFQVWGVIHYLARAGLHLVLIAMIWQLFTNVWHFPVWLNQAIIMFLMLLFNFLSAPAIPFIRALTTLLLSRLCQILELQVHVMHLLNFSCLMILSLNPTCLFSLDFQLSFGLTYGLVILNELRFWQTIPINPIRFYCLSIF